MAINIPVKVKMDDFQKVLKKRGWEEGFFNGKKAFIKHQQFWLWVAVRDEEQLVFISFPVEEDSRLHSQGIQLLKNEVESLGKVLGFTLPQEVVLWNSL